MGNTWIGLASIAIFASPVQPAVAARSGAHGPIDKYVRPYVDTNNFSGVVLAVRDGRPVFSHAFGYADIERRELNRLDTRFHIASMSMQYTAAAALRLIMMGKLSLDTPVSHYLPELPNAKRITVRHLLTQTSGIHDVNGLDDYALMLQQHQTPQTLVAKISSLPADRAPGTYEREEHSAFNLLALIIEKESKVPFAEAVKQLVFEPLKMRNSGIDDDQPASRYAAHGYAPVGVSALKPADPIHWSAKSGNGSAYTTASDHFRFVQGLSSSRFLDPALGACVFDLTSRVGYGWFRSNSSRFKEPVYSMNGRAPGFSSAVIYVPNEHLFVIALSNLYVSFTPDIADDVAAISLGRSYEPLALKKATDPTSLSGLPARFQFEKDFYQPNAVVELTTSKGEVAVNWPTGDQSPLIPTAPDRYIDRAYGVPVAVIRNRQGRVTGLKYDRFTGPAIVAKSPG